MEQKFYICKHCGNIIAKVKDTGVPVICCGEPMSEIIPGTTDAAVEKHVPVWTVKNGIVHAKVGDRCNDGGCRMKVVIVGGVAGGASAAARIRRLDEHAQIIMIERSGYVSYANCGLPSFIFLLRLYL